VRLDLGEPDEARRLLSRYDLALLTVGPFERLGADAHRLCIEAGVACVDVNDSLDAAREILSLDPAARERGVIAVTGAGLSPGLTTVLGLDALAGAVAGPRHLRLRLFVGGDQEAGRAAIHAMLASFRPAVPEIVRGELAQVPADDRATYSFPGGQEPVRALHYTTPEALTFAGSSRPELTGLESLDYRVHFEGMPGILTTALRRFPPLRSGFPARVLGAFVHVIHDRLRARKSGRSVVVAECDWAGGERASVAVCGSSYEATAAFAAAVAGLVLEGELAVDKGVHPVESAIDDLDALRALLDEQGVVRIAPADAVGAEAVSR
jgi:saccharopine dehydrogenase-like NADP-dependent oxidoreductase